MAHAIFMFYSMAWRERTIFLLIRDRSAGPSPNVLSLKNTFPRLLATTAKQMKLPDNYFRSFLLLLLKKYEIKISDPGLL